MPKIIEELITEFTASELFSLVIDIEKYPEFLPWCAAAKIIDHKDNIIIADLVISFKAFTEKYRSKVTYIEDEKIEVEMIQGPFLYLYNFWKFENLEAENKKSKLIFTIDFAFKSKIFEKLIGLMFKQATEKLSKAFIQRANDLRIQKT